MASVARYQEVARSLHPRLLSFFQKYPPPAVAALSQDNRTRQLGQAALLDIQKARNSNIPSTSADLPISDVNQSLDAPADAKAAGSQLINPFVPWKTPAGTWRGALISARRQADLYKLAAKERVLSLMPIGPKHPELRLQKRIEYGLRVQGTGVGKAPKGKLWERTMRTRLETRRKAMEGMPALIREWKSKGHGRGWKKWPK